MLCLFDLGVRALEKSLTLKVYQSIKNQLISLKHPPGSNIRERDIADTLGVSRTPVREAFQRLAHEGWLNIGEGKKIQVKPVSMADIEEIFKIRELVELFSYQWLMQFGEPRIVAGKADSILDMMAHCQDDHLGFTLLDLQFHSSVIKSSGYERINRFWTTVQEEVVRLGFMAMQGSDRYLEVLKEHAAIVDALWEKDSQVVMKAISTHLANSRSALIAKLGSHCAPHTAIPPLTEMNRAPVKRGEGLALPPQH